MASEGNISKTCTCKGDGGKRLYAKCPSLRRSDGNWHPTHGQWIYQIELPKTLTTPPKRRPLRRMPAAVRNDRNAAVEERDHVRTLLALAGDDAQVADEIARMLLAVPSGKPLPDSDTVARKVRAGVSVKATMTVAEYLNRWITRRKMDENTRRSYAGHIRNYLIPHLGDIRLDRLRVEHLDDMYTKIIERNMAIIAARESDDLRIRAEVKGKRPASVTTMQRIRATLRKALNDAIHKHRLIEFNAASHVELPTADQAKARLWTPAAVTEWEATGRIPSPVMVWTPEQTGRFLDYAEEHDPDLYALYAFVLRRGPRRGEAVGIRTDQIDMINMTVTITHQIATHGYVPVYKRVKTRNGDRNLAIDTDTGIDFTNYSARRTGWKKNAGNRWPDTIAIKTPAKSGGFEIVHIDLYFRQPNGSAWHPNHVSKRFERCARNAGLPPVGIHDGRHGAATVTKAAGGDLTDIKELLGHSTIVISGDIYTSLLEEVERDIAEKAASLIKRNRQPALAAA